MYVSWWKGCQAAAAAWLTVGLWVGCGSEFKAGPDTADGSAQGGTAGQAGVGGTAGSGGASGDGSVAGSGGVAGTGGDAGSEDGGDAGGQDGAAGSGGRPDGTPCLDPVECESLVCDVVCQSPSCIDGVKNGAEPSSDCGGVCPFRCATGAACTVGDDCEEGVCQSSICAPAKCTDHVANGTETDVDCGGGTCDACDDQKACLEPGDCESSHCQGHVCVSAQCTDGIQNGIETAADCGGVCAPCADGLACAVASDCASSVCSGNPRACQAPSCSDQTKNGAETGLDCGGSCGPCGNGEGCNVASDCVNRVCLGAPKKCQPAACNDAVLNGAETDTDCGGQGCLPCANLRTCDVGSDCAGGACTPANQCGAWVRAFGAATRDLAQTVAVAPNDDVVFGGVTMGGMSLGADDLDSPGLYLARYSKTGQHVWSKHLASSTNEESLGWYAISAVVDSTNNTYAAGSFFGSFTLDGQLVASPDAVGGTDAFAIKLGPGGNLLWSRVFATDGYDYAGVVANSAGDVFVTGSFSGTSITLGGQTFVNHVQPLDGSSDLFVAKLSGSTGAVLWAKAFGSDEWDALGASGIDAAGDLVLAGEFSKTIDFGDGALSSAGYWDIFVAKLRGNDGSSVWARRFGNSGFNDQASGLDLHPSGDLFLRGIVEGKVVFGSKQVGRSGIIDTFAARLDGANGDPVWVRSFDGAANELSGRHYIAADPQGNAVLAGSFQSAWIDFGGAILSKIPTPNGGPVDPDAYIVRLSGADGAHLSSGSFGAPGAQEIDGMTVNRRTGNLLVVGGFEQSLNLGTGPLANHGGLDAFLGSLGHP